MSGIRLISRPVLALLLFTLFIALLTPFATRPAAAAYTVPVPASLNLTVRETTGVARNAEVVRSGVPLPRSLGVLDPGRLAVVDAAGRAVPTDFQVSARWNAGLANTAAPIQWLLVSFPATVPARGSATYRLVTDGSVANPAPARPLLLVQNGDQITVDTGAAVFTFGADPGALFDAVTLANGTRLIQGGRLSLQSGGVQSAHPARRKMWIEHAGPLFAAVVVTGAYDLPAIGGGGMGSLRRYTFTAGSPTAIVRHAVSWEGNLGCNGCLKTSSGAPNGVRLDQVRDGLAVQLGGTPTVTAVGAFAAPAVTGAVASGRTAAVRQLLRASRTAPLQLTVDVAGAAASGAKADGGVLAASGPAGAVAIALDRMDRYEPQALRVLADGSLAVDLADDKTWLGNHSGLFATFAVAALPANPARGDLDGRVWAPLNHPLRAWPDAAWFAASDAVEEFPVGPLPTSLAGYDTAVAAVLNRTVQQIDALGLAGLTTFGVFPRYWGQAGSPGEIDCSSANDPTPGETWDDKFWCGTWTDYHNTAATVPVWAMRTGQVEWLDEIAVPAALRVLHTQMMQCSPTERWFYCGQAPAGYGAYRADFNSSHAYFDNLYLYYWLTGDSTVTEILRRGGESMRRLACATRGPQPVTEATGPGGPSCAADVTTTGSSFTGRVGTQWLNAFRFLGLASPDGSFLEDFRDGSARALTQHYAEAHRAGETTLYGFFGDSSFVLPGTYVAGPMWMYGFYDANTLYRLERDTGDAPLGIPALPPSHYIAAIARTLKDIEPTIQGDGTATGEWPKSLQYAYTGSRIGGTLASVAPYDRTIFTPEKCSVTALFLRAGEQSNDATMLAKGAEMVQFAIGAAIGDAAPLGKLEGQYLSRLHAAVAHLVNTGGTPPPPPPPSPTAPAAPGNLTAQAVSSTDVQLTWQDNASDEQSFRVERATPGIAGGAFQEVLATAANATGARLSGLTAGTAYTFRVRAANAAGFSAYSNTANATPPVPPPPPSGGLAAPSNLSFQGVSSTDVQLSWQDNSSTEQGFHVERSTAGGTFQEVVLAGANATGARITGLTPGVAYAFRVRAADASGFSAYSNTLALTLTASAPAAPSNLAARATSATSILLAWTDNANNEDQFLLEKAVGSGTLTQFKTMAPNNTGLLVTGLAPGTAYSFRVRAKNASGTSAYTNTATAATPTQ